MNYMTALIQLPLVKESPTQKVRTPEDAWNVCIDIQDLAQECFQVLCLNTKNFLLNRHMVSLGIVNASLVHPREVMRIAVTENAAAIVLTHNHPSGDPTPSAEDIRVTRQLIEAGKILDIKVVDHVIIGKKTTNTRRFISLREEGFCEFF